MNVIELELYGKIDINCIKIQNYILFFKPISRLDCEKSGDVLYAILPTIKPICKL